MHELLIATATNPSKRRRKQSAKQRSASMRNLAKARRARGGKRKNPVAAVAANPSKRRRRRAAASGTRRSVKRRRNPVLSLRSLSPQRLLSYVTPALVGGGGALANDVLYNMALNVVPATFAPEMMASLRTGQLRHVGKAASALLLATLAGFFLPRRIAEQVGTGALTVVGYNVVRDVANAVLPEDLKAKLTLGMYLDPALGYAGAGWNPVYGGDDWRAKTGLSAYLKTNGGNGESVRVPSQFNTRDQFGTRPGVMQVAAGNGT